ncbi:MAG TPA: hypothetical protein VHG28_00470 [Longimicrobiaceae bacterium]|nr:hypothetical protein [Longimicrobiaceae bacterium]
MRPPRYRFPDEVRSTTRAMATRMVRDGTIARTPEQLDTWISQAPEVQESLERGGWGTEFTSDDLLPLLHVFVAQAGGPAPEADAPPHSSRSRWLIPGVVAAVVIVLVLLAVATGALSR